MEQVRNWFLANRRSFPWREGKDPYSVLISEVMLQQTRASVVVDYFKRWISYFPDIHSLAKASEEEVIKLWEGLGYYSRARNLLELAKVVVNEYNGNIPDTLEKLLELKGLGSYTAGAILAFGFHKKSVALDGNVTRVASRFFAFEKDAKKHATELSNLVYTFLPDQDPYIVMEGLIELGATICNKKPACHMCPLKTNCRAHQKGIEETLPLLPQRKPITEIFRFVACIISNDHYLIRQGEKGKIMAGLYEFPYIECEEDFILSEIQKQVEEVLSIPLIFENPLKREKHHFTRFKANLFPFHFHTTEKIEIEGYVWVPKSKLHDLPFSSGHKRILKQFF